VIVALYVPGLKEEYVQGTVAPPPENRVTVVGHDTESAEGAEVVSVTVPEKPKRLAIETVPVDGEPATNVTTDEVIL
jgi:hypothetical protein